MALVANETGVIHAAGDLKKIKGIDESEIVWRADKFLFDDAGIDEVMQELGRWYDAKIVFDQKPTDHFNLEIERNIGLKKILDLLEKTERVKFEV